MPWAKMVTNRDRGSVRSHLLARFPLIFISFHWFSYISKHPKICSDVSAYKCSLFAAFLQPHCNLRADGAWITGCSPWSRWPASPGVPSWPVRPHRILRIVHWFPLLSIYVHTSASPIFCCMEPTLQLFCSLVCYMKQMLLFDGCSVDVL